MRFFQKPKQQPDGKIIVEGVQITYRPEHCEWQFTYRDIEFCTYGLTIILPSKCELDRILLTIESLKPELRSRMQESLSGYGAKLDDGELMSISLAGFSEDRSFRVSWSTGESWADLGVDFTIRDQKIVAEEWAD